MLCGQDARKKRDAADFEKFQAALAEDGGWMEVTAFRWLPTGHQVTAAAPCCRPAAPWHLDCQELERSNHRSRISACVAVHHTQRG